MSFGFRMLPAIVALALVGCGGSEDGLDRQAISGLVKLDGQPLKNGLIQFFSTAGDGAATPQVGGPIADGAYEVPAEGGPVPGSYKVVISSDSGKAANLTDGMPGGAGTPSKELIPAKYNTQTTLTAEVKSPQSSSIDFELKSK